MAFPILETERLRLVEIEQSYCQKIYEIFSLDEVTCYYGMNSFTEFGQASRMIESFQRITLRKRRYDGDCIKRNEYFNRYNWAK